MNELAIRVRGLRRTYDSGTSPFEAVRGVDLEIATGSIVALLGINGAGKTSTLEVIEGIAPATAGEVQVLGLDPIKDRERVRRRSGVLLQSSGFSGDLTVRETLRMWASTVTNPRSVDDSLARLDLAERAETRVRSLSGGEQRRLDLACTLMGEPEVVILDEPTTGLDPESRRQVWRLIRDLQAGGATVLFSTHYLEEAEALADRLAIMAAGRIVREGTAAEIVSGHPAQIGFATLDRPLPEWAELVATTDLGRTTLVTEDLQGTLTQLLSWAECERVTLTGLSAASASLESVFLAIADSPEFEGSVR